MTYLAIALGLMALLISTAMFKSPDSILNRWRTETVCQAISAVVDESIATMQGISREYFCAVTTQETTMGAPLYTPPPFKIVEPSEASDFRPRPDVVLEPASEERSRPGASTYGDERSSDASEPADTRFQDADASTGLWIRADQGLKKADGMIRDVVMRLSGKAPTQPLLDLMDTELMHIAQEGRVQALVMEIQRVQTEYASQQVQALRRKAMEELTGTMISIKDYERAQTWVETDYEREEVQATVMQMRTEARNQYYKTLELGSRRIDEMVDRPLHMAHPDFPKRVPESDDDRTAFERLFGSPNRPRR